MCMCVCMCVCGELIFVLLMQLESCGYLLNREVVQLPIASTAVIPNSTMKDHGNPTDSPPPSTGNPSN